MVCQFYCPLDDSVYTSRDPHERGLSHLCHKADRVAPLQSLSEFLIGREMRVYHHLPIVFCDFMREMSHLKNKILIDIVAWSKLLWTVTIKCKTN